MLEAIEDGREVNEELEYELSKIGVMMIFSSFLIKREEVVPMYYMRGKIDQIFGYSKDDLSILPIRVYEEESLRGYLFVMFLTLVVFMKFGDKHKNRYTVEEALMNMRNLKYKVYEKR